MKQQLLVPTKRLDVRGFGHIERFDERGKKLSHQDFENFIALPQIEYDKEQVRRNYNSSYLPTPLTTPEVSRASRLVTLFCTDSAMAESPSTERFIPGTVIASANKQYSTSGFGGQAALVRGTVVPSESQVTTGLAKFVFDWGLGAGNGTFRSLCWGYQVLSSPADPDDWWEPMMQYSMLGTSYGYFGFIDPSDGSIWTHAATGGSATITRYAPPATPSTLPTGNTNPITGLSPTAFDFAGDADEIWYSGFTTPFNLLRVSKSSPTILQTIARPYAAATQAWVAYDGTHLYVTAFNQAAPCTIYKILASDGSAVANWTHPEKIVGLGWDVDESVLWVASAANPTGQGPQQISGTGLPGRPGIFGYTAAGVLKFGRHLLTYAVTGDQWVQGQELFYAGLIGSHQNLLVVGGNTSSQSNPGIKRFWSPLGARTLLAAPETKTNAQTMRITYQFNLA